MPTPLYLLLLNREKRLYSNGKYNQKINYCHGYITFHNITQHYQCMEPILNIALDNRLRNIIKYTSKDTNTNRYLKSNTSSSNKKKITKKKRLNVIST